MNYFIDTEFLEGTQSKKIFNYEYGKTKPTIDLISIGIVSEDDREFYEISKDFNLEEAWNRYELKLPEYMGDKPVKVYWIRDNVLMPIFYELANREFNEKHPTMFWYCNKIVVSLAIFKKNPNWINDFKWFKRLINKYGKTNKEIAEKVKEFTYLKPHIFTTAWIPKFYGYYCSYDWVLFCWVFGKMIDLPKGFPEYINDLAQLEDSMTYKKEVRISSIDDSKSIINSPSMSAEKHLKLISQTGYSIIEGFETIDVPIKEHRGYPKKINEHHALEDAKWIRLLHKFLNKQ